MDTVEGPGETGRSGPPAGAGADRRPAGPRTRIPLACTLTPGDGALRLGRWRELALVGAPVARRSGGDLEVRFGCAPGVGDELEILVAAERTCCAFVRWELAREGDHFVLHVRADPERPDDVLPIATLFGLD